MSQGKRLSWIDIAKAITIFLVVFGHTVRGGASQRVVYSFHVATFFLLSGMTCNGDNPLTRVKRDFVRIMIPYYCFGLISILIFTVMGHFAAERIGLTVNTSFRTNVWELIYACPKGDRMKFNMPLWFLPCLFVTKLLYYVLQKVWKGSQPGVLFSSFGLAAVGFLYVRFVGIRLPFNISVALKMLAFFCLGRSFYTALPEIQKLISSRSKAILASIPLLFITALLAWFGPKVNYSGDTFPNIPLFLTTASLGSLGICFFAMGIHKCAILEYIGQKTLAILVMHKFPVLLFQTVGPCVIYLKEVDTWQGNLASITVSAIAILLCLIAEKIIACWFPFLLGNLSFARKKHLEKQLHNTNNR